MHKLTPIRNKLVNPFKNYVVNETNFAKYNSMKNSFLKKGLKPSKNGKKHFLRSTYTIDTFQTSDFNEENKSKNNEKPYLTLKNLKLHNKEIEEAKIKEENEANKFFNHIKNHLAMNDKENFNKNNYIYDNNLEKKKNKGQKLVQFRSISQRIKGIKEKAQLLKLVSHYLFPFVEKAVYKKKYKNKKAEKERKLKLLNDKIERNRRFVSLDSNSNNYLRCSVLYNRPYEYNALELQKVNLKMNLDLI